MTVGEWDQRQLCPDGACVGVIGPEGTCKVCGRVAPNWGEERKRGLIEPADEEPADAERDEYEDGEADEYEDDDGDGGDDDEYEDEDGEADEGDDEGAIAASAPVGWTERQLCSDGACVGVIGADGRCKVCGRAAVPEEHAIAARSEPAEDPDGTNGVR